MAAIHAGDVLSPPVDKSFSDTDSDRRGEKRAADGSPAGILSSSEDEADKETVENSGSSMGPHARRLAGRGRVLVLLPPETGSPVRRSIAATGAKVATPSGVSPHGSRVRLRSGETPTGHPGAEVLSPVGVAASAAGAASVTFFSMSRGAPVSPYAKGDPDLAAPQVGGRQPLPANVFKFTEKKLTIKEILLPADLIARHGQKRPVSQNALMGGVSAAEYQALIKAYFPKALQERRDYDAASGSDIKYVWGHYLGWAEGGQHASFNLGSISDACNRRMMGLEMAIRELVRGDRITLYVEIDADLVESDEAGAVLHVPQTMRYKITNVANQKSVTFDLDPQNHKKLEPGEAQIYYAITKGQLLAGLLSLKQASTVNPAGGAAGAGSDGSVAVKRLVF